MSNPQLTIALNLGTLLNLPEWSEAPRGQSEIIAKALVAEGYQAVQGTDDRAFAAAGLVTYGSGSVHEPHEALQVLGHQQAIGHAATTLHVGTGFEDEEEGVALLQAIVEASEQLGHPAYIETHRATVTQDIWRTLQWIKRVPNIRFNADFSHWYTGLEMPYGNFNRKLDQMAPIFDRVRFIHGRVGNGCSMQVSVAPGTRGELHLASFVEMWRRCFDAFLLQGGDRSIVFAPELLPAWVGPQRGSNFIDYASTFVDAFGVEQEFSDRWVEAKILSEAARRSFELAKAANEPSLLQRLRAL
ncbi:MAG TPA: hypothetical protein VIL30_03705 [Ramlibacter sp.]|jgi:hypothetical protein